MDDGLGDHLRRLPWGYLRRHGLVPGLLVLGVMALAQLGVGIVLMGWEALILSSVWTRYLALALILTLPHAAVGYRTGARDGVSVLAPFVAGIAPVVALVVALGVFGGPIGTPLTAPVLTAGAVCGWMLLFSLGMLAGGGRFDTLVSSDG